MNNKILIATVLTLSGATLATGAFAEQPRPGGMGHMPAFSQLDTDGNGELSAEEISSAQSARMAKADTNGDGLLSAEEMAAHAKARIDERMARMVERFDKDGDGLLSAEEMPKHRGPLSLLKVADTDQNGTISEAEYNTAQAIAKMVMQGHKRGPHGHGGGHHGDHHRPGGKGPEGAMKPGMPPMGDAETPEQN